jgi:Putative transposase
MPSGESGRTALFPSSTPGAFIAHQAPVPRYTHRVAISNRRLIAADHTGVTFRWKDYRIEGPGRYQSMKLSTDEFIRRFLMHVLPRVSTASGTTVYSRRARAESAGRGAASVQCDPADPHHRPGRSRFGVSARGPGAGTRGGRPPCAGPCGLVAAHDRLSPLLSEPAAKPAFALLVEALRFRKVRRKGAASASVNIALRTSRISEPTRSARRRIWAAATLAAMAI